MRCPDLRAYLDRELGPLSRMLMRTHVAFCPRCRKAVEEEPDLSRGIRRLEDTPVPQALRDKLMSDAMTAAASARATVASSRPKSPLRGVVTMKRAIIAAGVIAVATVIGLGIWPSNRGNAVLAQVARAMENVKSVHLTGYEIHGENRERRDFELWIEHPAKFRLKGVGSKTYEMADDGTKRVMLNWSRGTCSVTVSRSESLPAGFPALSWFSGEGLLNTTKMGIVESRSETLPDGRPVKIIVLAGMDPDYYKTVITIDEATDLLVDVEEYRKGKLETKMENFEYNADLPDSLFEIKIPANAQVFDKRHPKPESAERKALKDRINENMRAEGAHQICSLGAGDTCGTPNHSGLQFQMAGEGITYIWYAKSRNAYYVFGKAIATDSKKRGYRRTVEDGWLIAPYKPDRRPGTFQMRIDRPGDYRELLLPNDHGHNGFGAERIQNVGKGPLILMEEVCGIRFYGEAKVYPQGKVYHDGEIAHLHEIRSPGNGDYYDIAKADFGNLPGSEVKAMKADMVEHNRAWRRFNHNVQVAREKLRNTVEHQGLSVGPGYTAQDRYFKVDPETGTVLFYIPSRDSIYVAGRARLVQRRFFRRTERIVENEEVEAPGPEYATWYKEFVRRERWRKEYNAGRTKLTLDEWLEKHP